MRIWPRLTRYSIQWRNLWGDWIYTDESYFTLRGALRKTVRMATHKRSGCSWRVTKLVKGSDVVMFSLTRETHTKPYCNCPEPRRRRPRKAN